MTSSLARLAQTVSTVSAAKAAIRAEGFASFPQFLGAVMCAAGDPRHDPRLVRAPVGGGETDPSGGGFLLPVDYADAILGRAYLTGELLSRVYKLPSGPSSNAVRLPMVDEIDRSYGARFGGVRSYWMGEGDAIPASQPRFKSAELAFIKLAVLMIPSGELVEDGESFAAITQEAVSMEFAFRVENAIINGTGVGQPVGILNSPARITVPKLNGQAPATVLSNNISQMWASMWGPSRSRAVWLVHQDLEPSLYAVETALGEPAYVASSSEADGPFNRLYGRPVIPCEYCSAPGAEGDIVFIDLSAYVIADKAPRADLSMEVRFNSYEGIFRFCYRVNGQPLWTAPMTPANGTKKLSPYVTLASR